MQWPWPRWVEAMRSRVVEMHHDAGAGSFLAGIEMHEARDVALGEFGMQPLLEFADRAHGAVGLAAVPALLERKRILGHACARPPLANSSELQVLRQCGAAAHEPVAARHSACRRSTSTVRKASVFERDRHSVAFGERNFALAVERDRAGLDLWRYATFAGGKPAPRFDPDAAHHSRARSARRAMICGLVVRRELDMQAARLAPADRLEQAGDRRHADHFGIGEGHEEFAEGLGAPQGARADIALGHDGDVDQRDFVAAR